MIAFRVNHDSVEAELQGKVKLPGTLAAQSFLTTACVPHQWRVVAQVAGNAKGGNGDHLAFIVLGKVCHGESALPAVEGFAGATALYPAEGTAPVVCVLDGAGDFRPMEGVERVMIHECFNLRHLSHDGRVI